MTVTAPNILQLGPGPLSVPYSEEAEEATLGAMLLNPLAYQEIESFLKPDDFFLMRHGYIFTAMQRVMKQKGAKLDLVPLVLELKTMGVLEDIGGPAALTKLSNNTPSSINHLVYGHLVKRAATRRHLLSVGDDIKALALDENETLETTVEKCEKRLLSVTERAVAREGRALETGSSDLYDTFEAMVNSGQSMLGVPTGIRNLDALFGGFESEELNLIAGRPGMGKTSFLIHAALHAAGLGKKVWFSTIEMSEKDIIWRMVAIKTGIPVPKIKQPKGLSPTDIASITNAFSDLGKLDIFIDDNPVVTPRHLRVQTNWRKARHGIDLVCVDGLYKMTTEAANQNRIDRFTEIAEESKKLARLLKVPVVMTHQLNRKCEERADKRPMLSDLAESGRIEQEMDVCLFLYRDTVYNPQPGNQKSVEFIVGKNRNGATGTVEAIFDSSLTRFDNLEVLPSDIRGRYTNGR